MAVLENMAAAMQTTAEMLGQQAGNRNGGGGNGLNGGNGGPMTLAGMTTLMRRIIGSKVWKELCKLSTCQRVSTWSLPLIGWKEKLSSGGKNLAVCYSKVMLLLLGMLFRTEFYKKYFWNLVRAAKELELMQLKEGSMTMAEYTNKFEELCRFSKVCQGASEGYEEWKCIKYEGDLRSDIMSAMVPMEI
ncbi:uncharacterized protein LOC107620999 [Arachis ipaensis]|uniref:uncharacterized protein LOC107620999 n=1 Tax=Arachis ipaensis TaxID=130454 RepID=UPI0007AF24CE|nr:uncharacterized protein LOC107620999 [Arachis ipaensis]